ncbi:MAG: bifunctional UDP-3-O-[3-hydroxymyristoyl] N-acetylglucosamine deacetylase/3-hydroxyacyl-ACP dehydratase [Saprospirales bacterium]|nr:MAG: bifunctional UDP-3-O-[3-hydroxymyristoyl] N-acetylglucosamine deacetylase/3-hydroxyacyl-ACP dehydratase [Saprospirales bacterium]
MKQNTIKKPASVAGIGLHTGEMVNMTILPADPGHGIRFRRTDLKCDNVEIMADVSKVCSTTRGTSLRSGEAFVHTVEHVLAALYAMGIDNAIIELDGPEIPILDGSAAPFVKIIEESGVVQQDADREVFKITEPITYRDEATGTEILALPNDHFEVTVLIDFNSKILGQQYASLYDLDDFPDAIAPCRTFVFLHELEALLDQDLIKGGDLENAIVIADIVLSDDKLKELARRLGKESVTVEKEGILNTVKLHYSNEPARHKLLDIIGDISLLGKHVQGKIVAKKPGHTANISFTKILKRKYREFQKLRAIPHYDPNKKPVYDNVQINELLPHRYPFLLIDKVIEITDRTVVAIKNVTINEAYFQGHFPGNPVMPGVLQIEAMAQTGGILVLSNVDNPQEWDTYFLKIDNAKFKYKVVPGDTLILKLELLSPIRRGICHMFGSAYVGDRLVSEGELTAQIIKRNKND